MGLTLISILSFFFVLCVGCFGSLDRPSLRLSSSVCDECSGVDSRAKQEQAEARYAGVNVVDPPRRPRRQLFLSRLCRMAHPTCRLLTQISRLRFPSWRNQRGKRWKTTYQRTGDDAISWHSRSRPAHCSMTSLTLSSCTFEIPRQHKDCCDLRSAHRRDRPPLLPLCGLAQLKREVDHDTPCPRRRLRQSPSL